MRTIKSFWATGAAAAWAMAAIGAAAFAVIAARKMTQSPRPVPPVHTAPPSKPVKHFTGVVQYDILEKLLADDRRQTADVWLRELVDSRGAFRVKPQPHPLLGKPAPQFTLGDANGRRWGLRRQLQRGPVVLVFYLCYDCPACVHDLFQLNADLDRFHALDAEVVAISGDPSETTRARSAKFGGLGFPVLSDPGHAIAALYGEYRAKAAGCDEELLHGTFVIRRDGQVIWTYSAAALPFCDEKALLSELVAGAARGRGAENVPVIQSSTKEQK